MIIKNLFKFKLVFFVMIFLMQYANGKKILLVIILFKKIYEKCFLYMNQNRIWEVLSLDNNEYQKSSLPKRPTPNRIYLVQPSASPKLPFGQLRLHAERYPKLLNFIKKARARGNYYWSDNSCRILLL